MLTSAMNDVEMNRLGVNGDKSNPKGTIRRPLLAFQGLSSEVLLGVGRNRSLENSGFWQAENKVLYRQDLPVAEV